ncbi:MAG: PIN domain-containing protein [Bacteroidales bacterium]|jgi:predicted nucleic acid-binding protein
MKQTAVNSFFDSNIIVYCYSKTEPDKQKKVFGIIDNCKFLFISSQVLHEFCNVAHKNFHADDIDVNFALAEIERLFYIHPNSINTVRKANNIKHKHKFSFYDSLIVAAALECNCKILYSEDLQHKQIIENSLTIINPFK